MIINCIIGNPIQCLSAACTTSFIYLRARGDLLITWGLMWAIKGLCVYVCVGLEGCVIVGIHGSTIYQHAVTWADVTVGLSAKKTNTQAVVVGWLAQTHSLPTNMLQVHGHSEHNP